MLPALILRWVTAVPSGLRQSGTVKRVDRLPEIGEVS
ncbi:Uncharacterised protein [Stutzerimonas stutzeri]|nr:Uncharacterised protein [Stutzerimonas stutzeri]